MNGLVCKFVGDKAYMYVAPKDFPWEAANHFAMRGPQTSHQVNLSANFHLFCVHTYMCVSLVLLLITSLIPLLKKYPQLESLEYHYTYSQGPPPPNPLQAQ